MEDQQQEEAMALKIDKPPRTPSLGHRDFSNTSWTPCTAEEDPMATFCGANVDDSCTLPIRLKRHKSGSKDMDVAASWFATALEKAQEEELNSWFVGAPNEYHEVFGDCESPESAMWREETNQSVPSHLVDADHQSPPPLVGSNGSGPSVLSTPPLNSITTSARGKRPASVPLALQLPTEDLLEFDNPITPQPHDCRPLTGPAVPADCLWLGEAALGRELGAAASQEHREEPSWSCNFAKGSQHLNAEPSHDTWATGGWQQGGFDLPSPSQSSTSTSRQIGSHSCLTMQGGESQQGSAGRGTFGVKRDYDFLNQAFQGPERQLLIAEARRRLKMFEDARAERARQMAAQAQIQVQQQTPVEFPQNPGKLCQVAPSGFTLPAVTTGSQLVTTMVQPAAPIQPQQKPVLSPPEAFIAAALLSRHLTSEAAKPSSSVLPPLHSPPHVPAHSTTAANGKAASNPVAAVAEAVQILMQSLRNQDRMPSANLARSGPR